MDKQRSDKLRAGEVPLQKQYDDEHRKQRLVGAIVEPLDERPGVTQQVAS